MHGCSAAFPSASQLRTDVTCLTPGDICVQPLERHMDTWGANSFTISSTGCVLVGLGSHDKATSIGGLKPQHVFSQLWCLGSPRLRCRQVRTLPTALFQAGRVCLLVASSHGREALGFSCPFKDTNPITAHTPPLMTSSETNCLPIPHWG